jgi:heterodisulfide reductase subunit B
VAFECIPSHFGVSLHRCLAQFIWIWRGHPNSYQKSSKQTLDILSRRLEAFGDNSKMANNVMIVEKIFAKVVGRKNINSNVYFDNEKISYQWK